MVNFGSDQRTVNTIIGAEANLAGRLENIAEPGGIMVSYETYAHIRDVVEAEPLDPVNFKGIALEAILYVVKTQTKMHSRVIEECAPGLKLSVDLDALDDAGKQNAKKVLTTPLNGMERA